MKAVPAWPTSRFFLHRCALVPAMFAAFTLSMLFAFNTQAADPVVSNVRASQRAGARLVDVYYDLASTSACAVSVTISTNSGSTYSLAPSSLSGDAGNGIAAGANKHITWNAGADWAGQYSALMRVKVTANDSGSVIPPDPATVATAPSNGVVTLLGDSTAFLYTGAAPIQTGMATGTIADLRVAVLRGSVLETNGSPISAVTMTVNQHPEYGQTLTRTNGQYDLVVNGGGILNLNFQKSGYLPVQRTLDVPWQDYVSVDDVVMLAEDPNVTVLTMPSTNMQAAFGSFSSDADGTRRAVVLVPAGTRAWIFTEAGATQETATLTTRFTEFTVGTNGQAAMPADLPGTVAYTYCLSMGTAEAQRKVAGRDVLFSTQVFFYVDNFLGMPTGIGVPMGYYDNDSGAWVPSGDGQVIELMGTSASGQAEVDADGDGNPDSDVALAALGITAAERLKLAAEYSATQSLWRVPIDHFSTYDPNYGTVWTTNTAWPQTQLPQNSAQVQTPNGEDGYGQLDYENQEFKESVAIVGTPFSLHYASRRALGNTRDSTVTVPLSGAVIPPNLFGIDVTLSVAGTHSSAFHLADTNLSHTFEWDGVDSYGRHVQGPQKAQISIDYYYRGFYALPPRMAASFGFPAGVPVPGNIMTREMQRMRQTLTTMLSGQTPFISQGLGGWTLNAHHTYDPANGIMHFGSGGTHPALAQPGTHVLKLASAQTIMDTVAGNGTTTSSSEEFGGAATNAGVPLPWQVATGPDGSVYAASVHLFRVTPDGIITVVSNLPNISWTGVAVGPDGSVYGASASFASSYGSVYRALTNGTAVRVAGRGGSWAFSGDNGPATNASFSHPVGIAVGPDGTVFVADRGNNRIRRIGPDGFIHTVAGNGAPGYSGDNGPATNAAINKPESVALGPDGSLYIADRDNHRVRRVSPGGMITTVAGNGNGWNHGDGGLATDAGVQNPHGVTVSADGALFIAVDGDNLVRYVSPNGIIDTVAGTGAPGYSGNNGPALAAALDVPSGLALDREGSLYVADMNNNRIRRITGTYPAFAVQQPFIEIPSEDGGLVFEFENSGRHRRTRHALTGETLHEFGYTNGMLASVTDVNGNVTRIAHDAQGRPTSIVGPFGQTTVLGCDANGYLASVQNPAGETISLTHTTNGLLTSVQGARGAACTYTASYDAQGRAMSASDPVGGRSAVGVIAFSNGIETAATSAMGRITRSRTEFGTLGDTRMVTYFPDGGVQTMEKGADGRKQATTPEGVEITIAQGPDPRFGMLAPVTQTNRQEFPSGLSRTITEERTIGYGPNSVFWLTNRMTLDGREFTSVYSSGSREILVQSAAGRQTLTRLDAHGRTVFSQAGGLAAVNQAYDSRGFMTNRISGTGATARTMRLTWDSSGMLTRTVDSLNRTNQFAYDAAGRMTGQILPDERTVTSTYDAHGNRTSVTTPAGRTHTFTYSLVDQLASYSPPLVGGATETVSYAYNADRQLVRIVKPDGLSLSNTYNAAGQLISRSVAEGTYAYAWMTNGQLAAFTAPGGICVSNTYDGSLVTRLAISGPVPGVVNYAYDSALRIALLRVNGGENVTRKYDADGLLTNAGLLALSRDAANGLVTGNSLSNVTETFARNEFGLITGQAAICSASNILSVACGYDNFGRLTSRLEVAESLTNAWAYHYDTAGRLTDASLNGGWGHRTNLYQYDANDNCTGAVVAGATASATYDAQDRIVRRISASGALTNDFFFSAAGDLTNMVSNGSNTIYRYDVYGNLRQVILPGGQTNDYLVDGLGRRVARKTNNALVRGWIYASGASPVAEVDAQTNIVNLFVYGSRPNVPEYIVRSGAVYRVICDHLNSVRRVVDAQSGAIAQRLDYDEWGRVLNNSAPGFQPFGFAGGLCDDETGLIRFGVRDYNPESQQWTCRDPIGFAGGAFNLYEYCGNNPHAVVDPSGKGPGSSTFSLFQLVSPVSTLGDILSPAPIPYIQPEPLAPNQYIENGVVHHHATAVDALGALTFTVLSLFLPTDTSAGNYLVAAGLGASANMPTLDETYNNNLNELTADYPLYTPVGMPNGMIMR